MLQLTLLLLGDALSHDGMRHHNLQRHAFE
jgi:hypothetical protein